MIAAPADPGSRRRVIRAMVVGSGPWQVPLIEAFAALGCEVVTTGPNPAAPGHLAGDHAVTLELGDVEGHLRAARHHRIDAIATDQNDAGVVTVAAVAERLGLPGIGSDLARRFTDKYAMRRMAEQLGVPQPAHRLCRSVVDLERFASSRDAVVVKARDSQGGRGTRIVASGSDLREAFDDAVAVGRRPGVLGEELVEGVEYSVNGFKGVGTTVPHRTLAIGRKTHFVDALGLMETALFAPVAGDPVLRRLTDVNDRFITGTGLPFGQTHVEYVVRDGVPMLIEAAARGGGSGTSSHIVPAMSGIRTVDALAAASLGAVVSVAPAVHEEVFILHRFVRVGAGRLTAISGLDEARTVPGVVIAEAVHPIGAELTMGLRERHINLITCGPDARAAIASAEAGLARIRLSLGAA